METFSEYFLMKITATLKSDWLLLKFIIVKSTRMLPLYCILYLSNFSTFNLFQRAYKCPICHVATSSYKNIKCIATMIAAFECISFYQRQRWKSLHILMGFWPLWSHQRFGVCSRGPITLTVFCTVTPLLLFLWADDQLKLIVGQRMKNIYVFNW